MRAERRKLLCAGERERGKKQIIVCGGACGRKEANYCVWGSVRAERRKLLCAGEREGGKKQIIVCGGARGRKEGNYCVRGEGEAVKNYCGRAGRQ